jgi:hypothetical protein
VIVQDEWSRVTMQEVRARIQRCPGDADSWLKSGGKPIRSECGDENEELSIMRVFWAFSADFAPSHIPPPPVNPAGPGLAEEDCDPDPAPEVGVDFPTDSVAPKIPTTLAIYDPIANVVTSLNVSSPEDPDNVSTSVVGYDFDRVTPRLNVVT